MPRNVLLGSGVQLELEYDLPPVNKRAPAWRFHKDFPNKLCKTDVELDKADAEGWVDQPGKARRLPGHEKIFDQYHTVKVDEPVGVVIVKEKSEDEIKADALKAESDKVEEKRLEVERKAKEAEEKRLEAERKEEERKVKEYEEAKNPPGPRLCTLCGMEFFSLQGLNMHGMRMHRRRIVPKSDLPYKKKER